MLQKLKPQRLIIALLLIFIQACQVEPKPSLTDIPTTPAELLPGNEAIEPAKQSIVLISWDGSPAEVVYDLMDEGLLPNFSLLAKMGIRAEYAQSIDPSLTAAAHNSISSGSFPSDTGITSNSFHVPGDELYRYRSGYDEPMTDAEPIWETASRHGLTTAAVFYVGGSPSHKGQLADYTVGYGINDEYSKQWFADLTPANGWQSVPESHSPPLEGSISIQNISKVYLYVVDATDDGKQNYDTVVINTERSGGDPALTLQEQQWGPLVLLKRAYAGADFLIQEITAEQVTIYHSGVNHNNASPSKLLQAMNEKFGYFPAGADYYALEHGWITEEDYLHQLERQSTYMAQVAAWIYSTYHPDLMLTWQDAFDSAGHQFYLFDERQMNFSPQLVDKYEAYYRRGAEIANKSLGIMLDAFDLERTTLMLVGDHGMAPIHTVVYVNTILEEAGLLTLDSQNYVVLDKTKAFAVASGGAVHVYINLVGREDGETTVDADEYPSVQAQIKKLLIDLTDPDSVERIFQRVLLRDELEPLGLNHPNSGDVFAQANPGYHLDGWRGNDFVFEQASFYGQHGYDSTLPEMHTIFIAAGGHVSQAGTVIQPVRIMDYAPTIAELLGFPKTPGVDGSSIPAMLTP